MEKKEFIQLVSPYNPWINGDQDFRRLLPSYKRPIFEDLKTALIESKQMVALTGPRRVGKTTLLQQLIAFFLDQGVSPNQITYFSFDDPTLYDVQRKSAEFIDYLFGQCRNHESPTHYLFLDEIQRLDMWELYLKKYYDLKYNFKVIISGSASSPIFKKSHESLLGRINEFQLYPFSFYEYATYHLESETIYLDEITSLRTIWKSFFEELVVSHQNKFAEKYHIELPTPELNQVLSHLLQQYMMDGGYPEVWELPGIIAKRKYLYENQINKVIYEDLVLAAEFRKPEQLKSFYISLLRRPGIESSLKDIAHETEINIQQVQKYLPLLELTHLVFRLNKFRKDAISARKGRMKFYLVDLALRNALLQAEKIEDIPSEMLGRYAENLVFMALHQWRGKLSIDYFRHREKEIDFIVHLTPSNYLPIEVKFTNKIRQTDLNHLIYFREKYKSPFSFLISKQPSPTFKIADDIYSIPLHFFLMLF